MQNTTNFNLSKPDYNNVADIMVLNDNFDKLDKIGLITCESATFNGSATIILDTSLTDKDGTAINLTSGNIPDGLTFKFRIDDTVSLTGGIYITVNTGKNVRLLKPTGSNVTKLYKNATYIISWNSTAQNFFLASGADESDATSVGTDGSKVLKPQTFVGTDGEIHTGTIESMVADGYNNAQKSVGHKKAGSISYGASTYGDTNKYFYFQIPPKQYSNDVQFIRALESDVANKIGLGGTTIPASKILNDTTILGVKGTMTKQPSITNVKSVAQSGDYAYIRIPQGGYVQNASSGYPEIKVPVSTLVNTIDSISNFATGSCVGKVISYSGSGSSYVEYHGINIKNSIDFVPKVIVGRSAFYYFIYFNNSLIPELGYNGYNCMYTVGTSSSTIEGKTNLSNIDLENLITQKFSGMNTNYRTYTWVAIG